MKKQVFGRRLKRDINERKALFKSLMSSLVLQERIKTTEAKAKAIRARIEKLVTEAKKKGEQAANLFGLYLSPVAIDKLISDVAPRFEKRSGGYTRILRLGSRFSDNASMVLMEWVEGPREEVAQVSDVSPVRQAQGEQVSKGEKKVRTKQKTAITENTKKKSVKTAKERKTSRKSKTQKNNV